MLAAGAFGKSIGTEEARYRAVAALGLQVRAQAFTLAISDGFIVIVWTVVVYLMMMLLLRPIAISFRDLEANVMMRAILSRCVAVGALLSLARSAPVWGRGTEAKPKGSCRTGNQPESFATHCTPEDRRERAEKGR